jgi:hypothetical protein
MNKELKGIDKNTVVHCPTEELANQVLRIAHEAGYEWNDGDSFINCNNHWNMYKSETCYSLLSGTYLNTNPKLDKIITAEEFIKLNTDFVLPEKWCVKVTPENADILTDWKTKVSDGDFDDNAKDYSYVSEDGRGMNDLDFVESKYTEITFDQFKQYVLKEKDTEFVLPETWYVVVTKDNQKILSDWRGTKLSVGYITGMHKWQDHEKSSKEHNYDLSEDWENEITFEQFKQYVLKETNINQKEKDMKKELKFKLKDKVNTPKGKGIIVGIDTGFNILLSYLVKVEGLSDMLNTNYATEKAEEITLNNDGVWFTEGELSLIEETTTYKVTREQLKEIYDIACNRWKEKIAGITNNYLGAFKNEGILPESIVNEMRDAATKDQKPTIDRIFPKPKKLVTKEFVKYAVLDIKEGKIFSDSYKETKEDAIEYNDGKIFSEDGIKSLVVEVKGTYQVEE